MSKQRPVVIGEFPVCISVRINDKTKYIWFAVEMLRKVVYEQPRKVDLEGSLNIPFFLPLKPDVRLKGVWSHQPGELICDSCEVI